MVPADLASLNDGWFWVGSGLFACCQDRPAAAWRESRCRRQLAPALPAAASKTPYKRQARSALAMTVCVLPFLSFFLSSPLQIRPYDWSVWLAILLSMLAFPCLVCGVELLALKVRVAPLERACKCACNSTGAKQALVPAVNRQDVAALPFASPPEQASKARDESWRAIAYRLWHETNWLTISARAAAAWLYGRNCGGGPGRLTPCPCWRRALAHAPPPPAPLCAVQSHEPWLPASSSDFISSSSSSA